MPTSETTILDEGAIDKIAARTLTGHFLDLDQVSALCATVKHLRELAYLPKILSDDEEITFQEDNGRLLREKLELQSQLEQLRGENESLRKEVANSEKYQAQLLNSDSPDQVKPGEM